MLWCGRTVDGYTRGTIDYLVINGSIGIGITTFVTSRDSFPLPINNVIYLPAFTSWILEGTIDLRGSRLVCLGNVSIEGRSSETCFLISTGLADGSSLITSSYTVNLKYLTLGCPDNTFIFNLIGDGTNGIDLTYVNFGSTNISCGSMGTISNYSNFILDSTAVLNIKGGITFNGTFGTIGVFNSIFSSSSCITPYITLPPTLTITRRFRIFYSSMVVFSTGIFFNNPTTPNNSIILDVVNFSGPGTKISGIANNDVRASWSRCIGISNSYNLGQFTINDNVIDTIVVQNVYTPILGTATFQTSSRFSYLDRTLTYIGSLQVLCIINCCFSIQSGNNQKIDVTFTINGTPQDHYHTTAITTGAGEPYSGSFTGVSTLSTNNVFGVVVKNKTSSINVLIENLTFIIYEINT